MRFIFIFLLISLKVFAININGKLSIGDQNESWLEGEVKQLEILVWPLEDVNKDDLRSTLENKAFCDYFFIGKVNSIEYSKNNPLALLVKVDATLKTAFKAHNPIIWSYRALNIPMDVTSIKPIADPNKIQEFVIFDRKNEKVNSYWAYILGTLLITVLIIARYFRRQKRKGPSITIDWKRIILEAKNRSEIENIYRSKEIIISEMGGTNPAFENMFNVINAHQYKKEWTNDDYLEVNFILDEIKESLK